MADNSSIPVASGNETFANKDIAGVKFPKHIQYDSAGAEVVPATQTTLADVKTSVEALAALISGGKLLVDATIDPASVNANGRSTPANSAPVVLASQDYQDVAASQSSTTIKGQSGATGGAGDWLDFVQIFPDSTSPGQVTLQDGANTAVVIFYGGASSVGSLVPFTVPVRALSANGAWKIVTGANVHVRAVGNFQ